MHKAKPEVSHAEAWLRVGIIDVSSTLPLASLLSGIVADVATPFLAAAASSFPDVAIVAIDAEGRFSFPVRQAIAVARATGIRHAILAIGANERTAQSEIESIRVAFEDLAGKLEFTSFIAIPVTLTGRDASASSQARLRSHLAAIAADAGTPEEGSAAGPLSGQFAAHIACLSEKELIPGREYRLRLPGYETTASITAIKYRLDVDTLHRLPARTLARQEIGVCTIAADEPLPIGEAADGTNAARFTLSDIFTDEVIAAGAVDFALRRGMNVHWQPFTVTKELRAASKEQQPCIVWFTGLSGAGKSTIANLVEGWLTLQGRHTYLLDGDNVRHGLNKDLGFTAADRVENIRRVGEVARLFVDAGVIVLCSFISPFHAEREAVRSLVGPGEFVEVHVTAPLAVCEHRDPKGLYAKCRAGFLPNFTGIDSPYEAPVDPDLVLDTTSAPAAELAQRVVALLQDRGFIATAEEPGRAYCGQ